MRLKPDVRLVVFDVDGTLVDSRRSIQASSDAAFRHLGRTPPPYDAVRQTIGLSLAEGLGQLAPDLSAAELESLLGFYKSYFSELHQDPAWRDPLYDGAAELLDRLKADGWKIAMATGQSRRGVERALRVHAWADIFDSTHCADDGPGKPHPSMLLEAMRALGAAADRTIMIGDTAHDIRMARAAQVRSVGVTWGFHTRGEIEDAVADDICDSFTELAHIVEKFGRNSPAA
jgi:phosphoglycolate phosphatase